MLLIYGVETLHSETSPINCQKLERYSNIYLRNAKVISVYDAKDGWAFDFPAGGSNCHTRRPAPCMTVEARLYRHTRATPHQSVMGAHPYQTIMGGQRPVGCLFRALRRKQSGSPRQVGANMPGDDLATWSTYASSRKVALSNVSADAHCALHAVHARTS